MEHHLGIRLFQPKTWGSNLECLDEEFIEHSGIWSERGLCTDINDISLKRAHLCLICSEQ